MERRVVLQVELKYLNENILWYKEYIKRQIEKEKKRQQDIKSLENKLADGQSVFSKFFK